jgi:von Willebrand factor type D domain
MNSPNDEPLPFATCVLWGLFHYRTFDGSQFDFTGSCNYKLGGTQSWQVNVQPIGCTSWKKCSKQLTMLFGSVNVTALGKNVAVNGVALSDDAGIIISGVTIERHGNYTYLTYSDGVRVKWDEATVVDLTVDASFKGRVNGLCGDYDQDATSASSFNFHSK